MTQDVLRPASAEAASPPARSGALAAVPWAAVALLMLVTVLNNLDRFLPAILAEPMKRELGLSDTFLGVLNGFGFLVIYAVAGIPIARIADRGRFGQVISASIAGWSLMTLLGGFVASGWQLAATRAGVALGEAGSSPAAHAYISRNFRPDRRPTALAVLSLGAPLGGMASMMLGGVAGQLLGWRHTFMLMGVVGLLLAPVVLFALGRGQPLPRSAADARAPVDLKAILRKPSVLALCAASGFIALGGYASGAFAPAFLIRAQGMSVATVGLQMGLLNGGLGVAGMLSLGWLGGRLGRRDARWPLALLFLIVLVSIPFSLAAYLFAKGTFAIVCVVLGNLASISYLALTVACLHSLAPVAARARMSAILLFGTALLGGMGPVIVGVISDALTPTLGPQALGRGLLIVPASLVLAALCFFAAAVNFRRDMVVEPAD